MSCVYDPEQSEKIIKAIDNIGDKMETLAIQNRDMMRWLLLVVCVIAIGQKALDAVQSILGKDSAAHAIEAQK